MKINLWSVLKSLENSGSIYEEDAKEITMLADRIGGFGSELSWEVNQFGTWILRIFHHEESENSVELRISRNGSITCQRTRVESGITDTHTIKF